VALNDRQQKGIGFLVTAALFGLAGAILLIFSITPTWVPVVLNVAVAVAGILGIVIVAKPEV
jgi:hypothetical protein